MTEKNRPVKNKPIHDEPYGRLSIPRYVPDEPLTPGLRRKMGAQAIGFTARIEADDDA